MHHKLNCDFYPKESHRLKQLKRAGTSFNAYSLIRISN